MVPILSLVDTNIVRWVAVILWTLSAVVAVLWLLMQLKYLRDTNQHTGRSSLIFLGMVIALVICGGYIWMSGQTDVAAPLPTMLPSSEQPLATQSQLNSAFDQTPQVLGATLSALTPVQLATPVAGLVDSIATLAPGGIPNTGVVDNAGSLLDAAAGLSQPTIAVPAMLPTEALHQPSQQQIDLTSAADVRTQNQDMQPIVGNQFDLNTVTGVGPLMIIPKIGIVRPVVNTPINGDQWDTNVIGPNIGWLPTTGTQPKDALAMVFAAHITLSSSEGGPFLDLSLLQPGDQVIYRVGGINYIYEVQGSTQIGLEQVDKLYVPDGDTILLVTCDGWSDASSSFTTRLTVSAKLVRQQ